MHEFAFFWNRAQDIAGESFVVSDNLLVHRLVHVVRVKALDPIIFFNRAVHVRCYIVRCSKDRIECCVVERLPNKGPCVPVEAYLPLLKKGDCQEAVSLLTEVGASTIHLCITEKTQSKKWSLHEQERSEKMIIAAAEQSKNFSFPVCIPAKPLEKIIMETVQDTGVLSLFCDPRGVFIGHLVSQRMHNSNMQALTAIRILVGPEGDLTEKEKDFIKKAGFQLCSLTPTILRAKHALMVAVGFVRSYLAFKEEF